MKPEAARYLQKARKLSLSATTMLGVGLYEDAGRNAYLSAFNAARAFVYEQNGKVFKSHTGLRGEFARLSKDDARIDFHMRGFLGRAYNLKTIADYEEGPGFEISAERAKAAVEESKAFMDCIAALIDSPKNV